MNDAAMTAQERAEESARYQREHPIRLRLISMLGVLVLIAFGIFLAGAGLMR